MHIFAVGVFVTLLWGSMVMVLIRAAISGNKNSGNKK